MTEGVAGPPADVAGPPELRHFTSAFNTMAQVVRASLERQRRLVADASHQLRNPLAAVRLRADTLEDYVAEAGRPTYGSMTAELDRLENLLQQLLRLARAEQVSGSRKVGLSDHSRGVDGPRGRDRAAHGVLAARRRRPGPAIALTAQTIPGSRCSSPATTWSSSSTSRWTTRCGTPGRTPRSPCRPSQTDETVELVVSDDGAGLARRGPVEGGGTVLAGTGRRRRNRSRIGDRRRDRCGPRRHDRGGAGARRRPAGPLSACRWQVIRHAEQSIGRMSRRAFLLATAVLAAGCIAHRARRSRARWPRAIRAGCIWRSRRSSPNSSRTRYPDIAVDVLPTEGTVENLARLRSGDVDMGLALADVAERDRATGPADTAPQAVARVYENYLQVIVRDSAAAQQAVRP